MQVEKLSDCKLLENTKRLVLKEQEIISEFQVKQSDSASLFLKRLWKKLIELKDFSLIKERS